MKGLKQLLNVFNPFRPEFAIVIIIHYKSRIATTSRELLSQFSTCSGWSWFHVGEKLRKIAMYW